VNGVWLFTALTLLWSLSVTRNHAHRPAHRHAPSPKGTPEYSADLHTNTRSLTPVQRERRAQENMILHMSHMPRHFPSGLLTERDTHSHTHTHTHTLSLSLSLSHTHTHTLQSFPSALDRRWNTEHTLAKQVNVYVYYYYIWTVIASLSDNILRTLDQLFCSSYKHTFFTVTLSYLVFNNVLITLFIQCFLLKRSRNILLWMIQVSERSENIQKYRYHNKPLQKWYNVSITVYKNVYNVQRTFRNNVFIT